MTTTGSTQRLTIGLLICLLAASTAVAALADGEEPSPGDGVMQVTAVEPEAEDAMAALADSRTSADALPTEIAEPLDEEADFGMNPDLSRLLIPNTTHSVFAIPANGHVCMAITVGDGVSMGCPITDDVVDGKAAPGTVTLDDGDIAIYGVVPDGVESVIVATGASDTANVEVDDNAYYTVAEAGTPLRYVSYTGPSGAVEFPIYDPSLASDE